MRPARAPAPPRPEIMIPAPLDQDTVVNKPVSRSWRAGIGRSSERATGTFFSWWGNEEASDVSKASFVRGAMRVFGS